MKKKKETYVVKDASTLSEEEKFARELLSMPYTNDRVGQAFVRVWKGPKPIIKTSKLTQPVFSQSKINENFIDLFDKHGLMMGRLICGSKSLYRQSYPEHIILFNANVIIKSNGKIWYGDLDINVDFAKLKKIANELNEPLYVLYEMDARFQNEKKPFEFYKNHSCITILPD